MRKKKLYNKKNERGAITLFVLLACLFFVFILTGVYISSINKMQVQDQEVKQIQENYAKELNRIDEIYEELSTVIVKLTQNPEKDTWAKKKVELIGTGQIKNEGKVIIGYAFSNNEDKENLEWIIVDNKTTITETKEVEENGKYYFWIMDGDGNVKQASITINNIDKIKPTAGSLIAKEENAEGKEYTFNTWTDKSVYLEKVDGSDNESGHKKTTMTILKDGLQMGEYIDVEGPVTLTESGEYEVTIRTEDNAENTSTSEKYTIKIDKTIPVIESIIATSTTLRMAATDTLSGIDGYAITQTKEQPTEFIKVLNTLQLNDIFNVNLTEGEQYYIWVKDASGNISESTEITIEPIPTTITFEAKPTGWTKQNVIVTASTPLVQYTIETSIDGNNWTDATSQTFTYNGTMYARLTDGARYGDIATYNVTNIDKLAPEDFTVDLSEKTYNSITVNAITTDRAQTEEYACSGVMGYSFSIDDGNTYSNLQSNGSYTFENLLQLTTYKIKVKAVDKAGNETISTTLEVETNLKIEGNYSIDERLGTETLEQAITLASDGSVIRLLNDYTDTSTVTIDKSVKLDLQEYTLTRNATTITIDTDKEVEITGKGILINQKASTNTITNKGKLTLSNSVTIENTATKTDSTYYYTINSSTSTSEIYIKDNVHVIGTYRAITNSGIIEMDNGTIRTTKSTISGSIAILNSAANAKVKINNGTIEGYIGLQNNNATAETIINGGDIQGLGTNGIYNIGVLEVNGGTITGNTEGIKTTKTLTINNGSIVGTTDGINVAGTAEINGGNIESTSKYGINSSGTVNMNGGTVTGVTRGISSSGIVNVYNGVVETSVEATAGYGIYSSTTNVTIGRQEDELSRESPSIFGSVNAIYLNTSTHTFKFYNGVLKCLQESMIRGKYTTRLYHITETSTEENSEIEKTIYNMYLVPEGTTEGMNYSINDTRYAVTLQDALIIATDNSTIKLLNDYTDTSTVTVDKNVKLDVQTFTLTRNATTITINTGISLEITGTGTLINTKANTNTITNNGNLTLSNSIRIENTATVNSSTYYPAININNAESVTNINDSSQVIGQYRAIHNLTGELNINGGIIEATTNSSNAYAIVNNAATSITNINAGEISGYTGIYNVNASGVVNIYGGIVNGTVTNGINNKGILNINNGEINGTTNGITSSGTINMYGGDVMGTTYGINSSGTVNMDGGIVTGATRGISSSGTVNVYNGVVETEIGATNGYGIYSSTTNVTIGRQEDELSKISPSIFGSVNAIYLNTSTHTFKFYNGILRCEQESMIRGKYTTRLYHVIQDETEEQDISDGESTYTIQIYSKFLVADEETDIVKNYLVDEKIGATTLADALTLASNGSTIKLLNDYTDTSTVTFNKNIKLDLQTFTLTRNATTITIDTDKEVEIVGSGVLKNIKASTNTITNKGTLKLSDTVTIENTATKSDSTYYYTINSNTATSKVYISGDVNVIGTYRAIISTGLIKMDNGTVTTTKSTTSGSIAILNNAADAEVEINNGVIEGYVGLQNNNATAKAIINGGDIQGLGTNGIYNVGVLEVNGGTITGNTEGIKTTKTLTINNGSIVGTTDGINVAGTAEINGGNIESTSKYGINSSGTVNMNGGTVTGVTRGISSSGTVNAYKCNIEATNGYGIYSTTTNVTIGKQSDILSTEIPSIKGTSQAIYLNTSTHTFKFYNGILKSSLETTSRGKITCRLSYTTYTYFDTYEDCYCTILIDSVGEHYLVDGETKTVTLAEALEIASDGSNIKLINDYADASTVSFNKNVTFDLQSYTLMRGNTLIVEAGHSIEITGRGVITTDAFDLNTITNNGILTLSESVTIKNNSENNSAIYTEGEDAEVNLNNEVKLDAYNKAVYNKLGTVNVNDNVVITALQTRENTYGIYNESIVNVNNGTVEGYYGIYTENIVNINNGTIKGSTYGVCSTKSNVLTIGNEESEVSVTNPEIIGDLFGVYMTDNAYIFKFNSGKLRGPEEDKTFNGIGINRTGFEKYTYLDKDLESNNYCTILQKQEFHYSVDNETQTYTLEEAIEKASDGSTIKLLKDYTDASTAIFNKSVTFDVQNYTLKIIEPITINNNMTLNVKGDGEIFSGIETQTTFINEGTLNVDGNIKITGYSRVIDNKNITKINGGYIEATYINNITYAIYSSNSTSEIYITNGEIRGYYGIYNEGLLEMTGGKIIGTGAYGIASYGTSNIYGGRIEAKTYGIYSKNPDKVTIGESDNEISRTNPAIYGASYGIYMDDFSYIFNFNNGVLISDAQHTTYGGQTRTRNGYEVYTYLDSQIEKDKYCSVLEIPKTIQDIDSEGQVMTFELQNKSYTSLKSKNARSNQTITTRDCATDSKGRWIAWKVLTIEKDETTGEVKNVTVVSNPFYKNFEYTYQAGYNNFISELNNISQIFLDENLAISARHVGSDPNNPTNSTANATYYETDLENLDKIGAKGGSYLLAARYTNTASSRTFYYGRYITNGKLDGHWAYYKSSSGSIIQDDTAGISAPLRVILTLKPDIEIVGDGTANNPYTVVSPAVKDDEMSFTTLQSAIDNATGDEPQLIKVASHQKLTSAITIKEGQNIILDLNGKTITSDLAEAIVNAGNLTIINSDTDNIAQLISTAGVAINNTGTLSLGENEGVVTQDFIVQGTTNGILSTGTLNFYDGKVSGTTPINGTVTSTPTGYVTSTASGTTTLVQQ